MTKENTKEFKGVKNLKIGKDYISDSGHCITIDRKGNTYNNGFKSDKFADNIVCEYPEFWREATEEEVIARFKAHLIIRYGADWETMKIKKKHPSIVFGSPINNGSWEVMMLKSPGGWNVWNKNGLLYCNGIWVERLEEEEPKIHIKEAIKKNTVIHCETEKEAERILSMAHELGYMWSSEKSFKDSNRWDYCKSNTGYNIFDGGYSDIHYYDKINYTIIPSTQIADLEEEKPSEWTTHPKGFEYKKIKAIEKLPIDKVTIKNLDIALRMVGIQLDVNIIDKVIDLVELIENKGDEVTIKDIISLQQTWSRSNKT